MRNAVSDVQTGCLSYRKAAQQYGIPKSTIRDHVTGLVEIGRRSGPRPVLSKEEEEAIVQWLIKMARIGYGRSKEQVKDTVKRILDKDGRRIELFSDNRPGRDWWYCFLRRHPQLATRMPQNLEITRAMACSEKVVFWLAERI